MEGDDIITPPTAVTMSSTFPDPKGADNACHEDARRAKLRVDRHRIRTWIHCGVDDDCEAFGAAAEVCVPSELQAAVGRLVESLVVDAPVYDQRCGLSRRLAEGCELPGVGPAKVRAEAGGRWLETCNGTEVYTGRITARGT